MTENVLQTLPPWLFWTAAAYIGLCIGSFLNVVIHRLPIMMQRQEESWAKEALELAPDGAEVEAAYNLATPASTCPGCGHRIRAWENIPVLSWLLLRGRCAGCGIRISLRYPIVEILTAVATCAVLALFGPTWSGLWVLAFTWSVIALTFIDLDHQLLPDAIVLPLLWLGLLVNVGGVFVPLADAVVGAAVGYGALWSVYWGFKLITGKEGMGHGDFKLMGAVGAWLGWVALPGVVLLASFSGIIAAVAMMLGGRMDRETPMPFGPFIAVAGWLALMLAASPISIPGLL